MAKGNMFERQKLEIFVYCRNHTRAISVRANVT